MTKLRIFVTVCLLTGCIAVASQSAMASKNNPKPTSGTIDQGSTGPGASPTPRPTTSTTFSVR